MQYCCCWLNSHCSHFPLKSHSGWEAQMLDCFVPVCKSNVGEVQKVTWGRREPQISSNARTQMEAMFQCITKISLILFFAKFKPSPPLCLVTICLAFWLFSHSVTASICRKLLRHAVKGPEQYKMIQIYTNLQVHSKDNTSMHIWLLAAEVICHLTWTCQYVCFYLKEPATSIKPEAELAVGFQPSGSIMSTKFV